MGAVAALVRKNLLIARRYPVAIVNVVLLAPLYQMALPTLLLGAAFLVDGTATGLAQFVHTSDLAGWLTFGMFCASLTVGAMSTVVENIATDRQAGMLEANWATPVRRETFVVGGVLTSVAFTAVATLVLGGLAAMLLGANFGPGTLLVVPIGLVMFVALLGYAYFAAAGALKMNRTSAMLDMISYVLAALSGVAFPITVLPDPLRGIAMLLPTTWGLDLMRHYGLGSATIVPVAYEWGLLAATSLAAFVLGRRAFLTAERTLRVTGRLALH